jgi:hypothetical protein
MRMSEDSFSRLLLQNSARLRHLSVLAVVAGASTLGMQAQQSAGMAVATPLKTEARLESKLSFPASDLATVAGLSYSSSVTSSDAVAAPVDATAAERLNLSEGAGAGLQPPPRRRYGRPRYNDNRHNPDGSSKYTFVLGAGFTAPVGGTYHNLNTSYGIQVGAGRNFDKKFGVVAQFDYDKFGFNGRTLGEQQIILNNPNLFNGQIQNLDGTSHVWSFTLNPIYNIIEGGNYGAYVVGGVGFYHKTANFTIPGTGVYYDYYGNAYQYQTNQTIDKYTSNAPGFNGGFGLTYKPSKFSGERLFVEARYVFVDNSPKAGFTIATYNQITPTSTNLFPANSSRTTYTVYKAGIRF